MLIPNVRRTWAPCGETPIICHRYRRDKVSAISAVTISPTRRRCGFYAHFHLSNITHVEVAVFLRLLLRHLRGHIVLLWRTAVPSTVALTSKGYSLGHRVSTSNAFRVMRPSSTLTNSPGVTSREGWQTDALTTSKNFSQISRVRPVGFGATPRCLAPSSRERICLIFHDHSFYSLCNDQ